MKRTIKERSIDLWEEWAHTPVKAAPELFERYIREAVDDYTLAKDDEIIRLRTETAELREQLDTSTAAARINAETIAEQRGANLALQIEIDELRQQLAEAKRELESVECMVDDLLYDPKFKPVDAEGNRIRGGDYYLLDHPIQHDHLPALREWFVNRTEKQKQPHDPT